MKRIILVSLFFVISLIGSYQALAQMSYSINSSGYSSSSRCLDEVKVCGGYIIHTRSGR